MESLPRFFQPPKGSFFLFGPRGTGKSTFLASRFGADALNVDLLHLDTFREFTSRPERLRNLLSGSPGKRVVVIDEIQKAPSLLDEVHALMERDKRIQFILTGSSSRKLKRSGADLLAGRAVLTSLHPFMAAEMGPRFSLERALAFGLIPLIVDAAEPEETLRSYAALYLKEEVQAEGLVRNIGSFARFLETMSFSHGEILNLSHVSREAHVERKTAEGYLEILEDLLLGLRLPVFQKRAKRSVANHPKFYFFDAGVYKSLRPRGPLDAPEQAGGPALEGLVLQHLRAWNDYGGARHALSYWRTRAGNEVDFVIYGEKEFAAIEVKNSLRVRPEDLSGLESFGEDYPKAKRLLLYRGAARLEIRGVLCLPCGEFLAALVPGKPLLS